MVSQNICSMDFDAPNVTPGVPLDGGAHGTHKAVYGAGGEIL